MSAKRDYSRLVGPVIIALGTALTALFLYRLIDEYRLQDLPMTTAEMVECTPTLETTQSYRRQWPDTEWRAKVKYVYKVDDKVFRGTKISNIPPRVIVNGVLGIDPPPPAEMAELCRRFAAGKTVPVHYDPAHPSYSFLYFTSPLGTFWPFFIVSLFFVAVGAFAMFIMSEKAQRWAQTAKTERLQTPTKR